MGYSEYSGTFRVGMGPLPSTMVAPTRALIGNSDISIGVEWTALTGETLPVLNYILYMDDGNGVVFTEAFRGGS